MSSPKDGDLKPERVMKDFMKVTTSLSETACTAFRTAIEDGADVSEVKQLLKDVDKDIKLGKKATKLINQHKNAEQDGKVEFLANYLKTQLGINDADKDPYGDGIQSRLKGYEGMKLRTQWATGFDYNPVNNKMLSDWCRACFYAEIDEIKKYLNGIVTEEDKTHLLERRESMLRFCGILHVICGARMNPSDHIEAAKLLIEAGCKVNVKDVAGYTPLHHCLTQYGNETSLGIAKLLVENGAKVNAINRFGCTPLFEPCMNFMYNFIEFLCVNGADPSLKDNDGVSCQVISAHNPRVHSLFSKGYRAMAKREKAKSSDDKAEEGEAVCSYCETGGKLNRCSACMTVRYCSRACQTRHWKEHKLKCKEFVKSMKSEGEVVYVKPVANPYGSEVLMFNEKTKKVDHTSSKAKKIGGTGKSMKIKIQVSLGSGMGVPVEGPMLIYNRDKSFKCYITVTDPSYKQVFDKVVAKGYGGVKAYFLGTMKPAGDLQIDLSKTFAETF